MSESESTERAAGERERATRLAPSPTGRMHLGHAWSFLCTWALARESGWRIILRLEDLDASRASVDAERDALWMLEWLGIDWDGPLVRQSQRGEFYRERMRDFALLGRVFEAPHSRSQLRAAQEQRVTDESNAPNEGDAVVRFPASLRPPREAWRFSDEQINHRFALEPASVRVVDELLGERMFDPAAIWGDPLVWLKSGVPSYQLAVSTDDCAMGITDVVRGEDLLESAALQQVLHEQFDARERTRWWHLPLVLDESGRRLAKRHDALAIATLAERGATADRVRGLVAWWAGVIPECAPLPRDSTPRLKWERALRTHDRRPLLTTPALLDWVCGRA